MTTFIAILVFWVYYKLSLRGDKKRGYSTYVKGILEL
jgi:hypothetical protein